MTDGVPMYDGGVLFCYSSPQTSVM